MGTRLNQFPLPWTIRNQPEFSIRNLLQYLLIKLEGVEYSTLVREKQKDYLRNRFIHVDFQSVSQTEKIRAEVGIEFINVSPAVKDFSGVIVEGMTEIEVEALPKDLPERFVIDLFQLNRLVTQSM